MEKKKKIGIAIGVGFLIVGLLGINIWKKAASENVTANVTNIIEETVYEKVMTPGTLKLANEQTVYFDRRMEKFRRFLL
jgi:HlyD family secretion protein